MVEVFNLIEKLKDNKKQRDDKKQAQRVKEEKEKAKGKAEREKIKIEKQKVKAKEKEKENAEKIFENYSLQMVRLDAVDLFYYYDIPVEQRALYAKEIDEVALLPKEQRKQALIELAKRIKVSLQKK